MGSLHSGWYLLAGDQVFGGITSSFTRISITESMSRVLEEADEEENNWDFEDAVTSEEVASSSLRGK